jgi:hypothetical protein
MKKLILSLFAFVAISIGVIGMSAFEAHVINVTAKIENALNVTPEEITYGTVFPQEQLKKNFTVALSQSFLEQDRVDTVNYVIKKKSKPRHDVASFPGGVSGHVYCLNNHPTDPGNPNDPYYTYCYPNLCDRINTELFGASSSIGFLITATSSDFWKVNLKVPCFEEMCDQAYDPDIYGNPLDPRLEHEIFGCDLWVEVKSVYEDAGKTYCGDGIIQQPNDTRMDGPKNDGIEQCDSNNIIYLGQSYFCYNCKMMKCQSGEERNCLINPNDSFSKGLQRCSVEGLWGDCEIKSPPEGFLLYENFEDSYWFTIGGGGAVYWGIAPLSGIVSHPSQFSQGSSSQSGKIIYGLVAKQYAGSPAATITIPLPDLSGYTNLKFIVALAGADNNIWENTHRDSLHIVGATTSSPVEVNCLVAGCTPGTGVIDSFLPLGHGAPLTSQIFSTYLHPQFHDFEYVIDSSLKSITFAFASTGYDEVIGIDSVRITGDPINP